METDLTAARKLVLLVNELERLLNEVKEVSTDLENLKVLKKEVTADLENLKVLKKEMSDFGGKQRELEAIRKAVDIELSKIDVQKKSIESLLIKFGNKDELVELALQLENVRGDAKSAVENISRVELEKIEANLNKKSKATISQSITELEISSKAFQSRYLTAMEERYSQYLQNLQSKIVQIDQDLDRRIKEKNSLLEKQSAQTIQQIEEMKTHFREQTKKSQEQAKKSNEYIQLLTANFSEAISRSTQEAKIEITKIPIDFRDQIIRIQKASFQQSLLSITAWIFLSLSSVIKNDIVDILLFIASLICIMVAFFISRKASIK